MQRADSLEKVLMLGKIEGRRRGCTEDEMVGWINGQEFEQTLEDSERQGSLACCSLCHKELDTIERLNNKKVNNQVHEKS